MGVKHTTCDGCGVCCLGQNLLPIARVALDCEPLPTDLEAELRAAFDNHLNDEDGAPCIWLNRVTGRCAHYEHRPSICRDMEVGGEDCLRIRAAAGLQTQALPGGEDTE